MTYPKVVMGVGDSHVTATPLSFLKQAMTDADLVSNPIAYLEAALGATSSTSWYSGGIQWLNAYAKYCNIACFQIGSNQASTPGTLALDRSLIAAIRAWGLKVIACVLAPRTDSVLGWTGGVDDQVQDATTASDVRSVAREADYAAGKFDDLVNMTGIQQLTIAPANRDHWKQDGTPSPMCDGTPGVSPGLHPISQAVHALMAPPWRTAIANMSLSPALDAPSVASVTQVGGIPTVRTNQADGTLYCVVVPNGDPAPSVAQIKAGLRNNGTAASAVPAPLTITSSGTKSFAAVTTLSGGTSYEVYFVHTNARDEDSNIPTIGFLTNTGTVAFDATSTGSASASSVTVSHAGAAEGVTGYGVALAFTSNALTLISLTITNAAGDTVDIKDNLQVSQTVAGTVDVRIYKTTAVPPQGTVDIVATFSGSANPVIMSAVSVKSGDPVTVFSSDNTVKATATSATPSVTCPTAATELVMDANVYAATGLTALQGADQIKRWGSATATIRSAGSTQPGTAGGVMSWTLDVSAAWAIVAASFKAGA